MRHFQTSAVERRIQFTKELQSHPMEAGWAAEAIFFLIVEEISGLQAVAHAAVEISADGINWVMEGTEFPPIDKEGHYYCKVKHFGNWLRVSIEVSGKETLVKASVHLHLKS